MQIELIRLHGMYALRIDGGRAVFMRFRVAERPDRVVRAIEWEYPGATVEGPECAGWLFDNAAAEALQVSRTPLFEEVVG